MTRKNNIFILFLSLLITTIIYAGTQIKEINAHSESDYMVIEWQTTEEINIKYFVVQRNTPNGAFVDIATVAPQGSYSFYRFVDKSIYKTADKFYNYRIKIEDGSGNPGFSGTVGAPFGQVSGVKRTWGSIKALFR